MNKKVTELEKAVLMNIAQNEYNSANYGMPSSADETTTYSWAVAECGGGPLDAPQGKVLSGVMSSLGKKGLIWSHNTGSSEDCTGLTDEGFQVWEEVMADFNAEEEAATIDIKSDTVNTLNIKNTKEIYMNKKSSKKVDSKAALKRAWRMVRVNGLDKMAAFDLAWKMERGELPKTFKTANESVRFVDVEVKNVVMGLIAENEAAYGDGDLLRASKSLEKMYKVLVANGLTYINGKFTSVDGLTVIFTEK
jgi:hypothetical protein